MSTKFEEQQEQISQNHKKSTNGNESKQCKHY